MGQIQTLGRLAVTGWRDDSEHDKGRTLVQAELSKHLQLLYVSQPRRLATGSHNEWIMTKKSDVSGKLELGA